MRVHIRRFLPFLCGLFACSCVGPQATALRTGRRVALVFDDGPVSINATPLLEVLREEQVTATFSLIGRNVVQEPETAKAIVSAGHEVANHSQTHASPSAMDDAALDAEVAEADKTLREVLGKAPHWYWPPYLHKDERVRAAVAKAGLEIYEPHHLVSSNDYDKDVSSEELRRRATTDVRDGTVILFHEWRRETREQLPAILAELRRQGCVFMSFSELRASLDSRPAE